MPTLPFRRGLAAWLSLAGMTLAAAPTPETFLTAALRPGPATDSLLPRSDLDRDASSTYDAALAALWLMAVDRRDEAGRTLASLAQLQAANGSLPFAFPLASPAGGPAYVRAGAMAWAGYAAARYLDEAPGGPARTAVTALAHRVGGWLLARFVDRPGDPREGLITGGAGTYRESVDGADEVVETFVPGEVSWAAAEHNIDAYFCFRELARVTGNARYEAARDRLGRAIVERLWDDAAGQFRQGAQDAPRALDGASWGSLFLLAVGDRPRARRALATAERVYASHDPASGARGHRPYAGRPVIENQALARHFRQQVHPNDWDRFEAVWPEGSAGVALAALRLGDAARARRILADLEPLRVGGGLRCLSRPVPLEFTHAPAFAGTAWVELVRAELAGRPAVW